jgi:hypothetical protein
MGVHSDAINPQLQFHRRTHWDGKHRFDVAPSRTQVGCFNPKRAFVAPYDELAGNLGADSFVLPPLLQRIAAVTDRTLNMHDLDRALCSRSPLTSALWGEQAQSGGRVVVTLVITDRFIGEDSSCEGMRNSRMVTEGQPRSAHHLPSTLNELTCSSFAFSP